MRNRGGDYVVPDFHLHTHFSRHAKGDISEYLAAAQNLGLTEVCFAEHVSREYLPQEVRDAIPYSWMEFGELPKYLSWLEQVRERSPLPLYKGLEADYIAGYEKTLGEYLASAESELDFVLGSIHFLQEYNFKYFSTMTPDFPPLEVMLTYYARAKQAVESGLFDSIAHLNLGWQAVPWPESQEEQRQAEEAIADVIQTAANQGVGIEVNTRAFNYEAYGTKERYDFFLGLIADCGAFITLGSDAHCPEDVGRNYPTAIATLQKFGIDEVAVFIKRERHMRPIKPLRPVNLGSIQQGA